MLRPLLLLSLLMVPVVGCSTTRSYSVTVKNEYAEPMTLWLTKNGPPMETAWLPPEDLAMMLKFPETARLKGIVVLPGEQLGADVKGTFDPGVSAVLRVYRGRKTLEELFAIGRDSPNRTDIELPEGASRFVINRSGETVRR